MWPHCLALGEVHIWSAALEDPAIDETACYALLSEDECRRAQRFIFEKDRHRFVVARSVLRRLLGFYLQALPEKLVFQYGARGKPYLAGVPLHFNMAHSAELALFAFARDRVVGVDIEKIRTDIALQDIAARFFAPGEQHAFARLKADKQRKAFFVVWTRKEAFIKAMGMGVFFGLDQFEVCVDAAAPEGLVSIYGDREKAKNWTLQSLNVSLPYTAAFAVHGKVSGLFRKSWHWV